ncbi:uncharacterized protein E6C27_scaffold46G002900 [Cucumis melo var. makuwa]|uniref:Uncharacterized protein LOC103494594 n=2 Tax=Cucumis melo TaxID=3656 RepID=A0A1S3BXR7_CUCME|nr:uncharacterized protein LOC103494594 [Cucumis melo]XP_050943317.1 uncharacterized protein LOC103494594 [Cucumis melo]KAA0044542.1 uncharacterized protein E6C27_scaffold46G002900 [Cucumis melo var. makuwa]
MESHSKANSREDLEVDIIEGSNKTDPKFCGKEDPDATEYSSSFGETSDADNCSGFSEGEVETQFFGDIGLPPTFGSFSSTLQIRKRKLTAHWQNFIRPLMWRCKWTELRIKEIESQALKYSRALAVYEQEKVPAHDPTMEDFFSKTFPFSSQYYRRKAMKRRKRKKIEDAIDISSYMSHHNLFSYFENKRSELDGTSVADEFANPVKVEKNADSDDKFGINNDSILESRDTDNSLEQVLWKIEVVHSRLHKLKGQMDKVMSKNAAIFSSSENLSLLAPCEAQTSSAPSPTFSAGNGELSVSVMCASTQRISECDIGDLMKPESAISSFGDAILVPDIIESTVGNLTATDVSLPQPQIGDSTEAIVDNVLTHNEVVEAERNTDSKVVAQPVEKHREPEKVSQGEGTSLSSNPTTQPDPMGKALVSEEQSALKKCLASDINFPRNKRKRGERKAGPGSWNKKHSSEPDSQ